MQSLGPCKGQRRELTEKSSSDLFMSVTASPGCLFKHFLQKPFPLLTTWSDLAQQQPHCFVLIFCISYFSCCCRKIPVKSQFKEERLYFGSELEGSVHHENVPGHIVSIVRKEGCWCYSLVNAVTQTQGGPSHFSLTSLEMPSL